MSLARRFPWWLYAILLLCVCGGIASIASPRQQNNSQLSSASSVPTRPPVDRFPTATPRPISALATPTAPLASSKIAAAQPSSSPATPTVPLAPATSTPAQSSEPQLTEATVNRVVDGDTLEVLISRKLYKVRIIGVDTPETVDPNSPVMCYGKEATAKTRELVAQSNDRVLLEKDISEVDRYNRLLRYVWLQHPDGRRMLNLELVKWGFAQVSTYPPDVKYTQLFLDAQQEARDQNRGLWAACGSFGVPAASSAPAAPVLTATPVPARPTATSVPDVAPTSVGSGPEIVDVYYDGQEPSTEGDEYVVIQNTGSKPVNMRGYRINAGDKGQNFTFPSFTLEPGASVRVYTNRSISGSFTFGTGRAIWNNRGDCGYLYNTEGKEISQYCYP